MFFLGFFYMQLFIIYTQGLFTLRVKRVGVAGSLQFWRTVSRRVASQTRG